MNPTPHHTMSPPSPLGDATQAVSFWSDALRQELAGALSFDTTAPVCEPKPVSDDALKLGIFDKRGQCLAVAHCAPPGAPQVAAQLVEKSRAAADRLGNSLNTVILEPIKSGEVEGLSYSVTPYRRPLSENRLGRWRDRRRLRGPALDWLAQATAKTCVVINDTENTKRIEMELARLDEIVGLDTELIRTAHEAKEMIASTRCPQVQVLQHGDFWDGNLLIAERRDPWPFVVIDWPGSRGDGEPIFDLVRFAISVHLHDEELGRQLKIHSEILGCTVADTACHLLIALAGIASRLNNFPVERFAEMANYNYARLSKALATQTS